MKFFSAGHGITILVVAQGPELDPGWAQLYVYDEEEALQKRMGLCVSKELNEGAMGWVQRMLSRCNPFPRLYRQMKEQIAQGYTSAELRFVSPAVPAKDAKDRSYRRKRYACPTSAEIARIFTSPDQ
eukprot:gene56693-biopygen22834